MNAEDLPSDSDQSDDDYVPSDGDGKLSEEESDDNISDEKEHQDDPSEGKKGKKRRKRQSKSKKLKKVTEKEEEIESKEETKASDPVSAEAEKKRVDALWADFMKDVGGVSKKPATSTCSTSRDSQSASKQSSVEEKRPVEKVEEKKEIGKENTVKVTEIFQFAGEEVRVEKEVASDSTAVNKACPASAKPSLPRGGRAGGLASVLDQLGKKPKLSVLEKSKLDWSEFKKDEGIEEELQIHNKGKEGYLEKQDFLERADHRQFELEKQLRASKRSYL